MTQEEQKGLLLRDLSARLQYGVKCKLIYSNKSIKDEDATLFAVDKFGHFLFAEFGEDTREFVCKPYLRPMSSMTEEEKSQYSFFLTRIVFAYDASKLIDWLNAHHFDYRGLIPLGLANDATGLNIY